MKLLKDILIEEVIKKFEDVDEQEYVLMNIDNKGDYVYEKLEEDLVSKGYPKGASEDARTSELIFYPEVYPINENTFVERFMNDYDANPQMQFDLDNMNEDDENALHEMIDRIMPYAANHPNLLKFKFEIEESPEEYKRLRNL